MRAAHQKRFHQVKVVWEVGSAAIPLLSIGFLEALGALPILLHPVFVAAVEGQFNASGGEHLQAVALIGFQGLLG